MAVKKVRKKKPLYRIPSMQEIAKIPWNGLTAVSTFSGCGGSCLGYRWAGFKVLWASEFVPAAQETYKANHPDSILNTQDIRDVKAKDILKAIGLKKGELDFLDGSPPCFIAGTPVATDRGVIPIEDVRVGDRVLTHRGRWKHVTDTLVRRASTIVVDGHIEATSDHPFWARTHQRSGSSWDLSEPEWVNAESVRGLFCATPIDVDPLPVPQIPGRRAWNLRLNDDFWWMVGRWLGDGWLRIDRGSSEAPRERPGLCEEPRDCLNCGEVAARSHERYPALLTAFCSESCRRGYGRTTRRKPRHEVLICCSKEEAVQLGKRLDRVDGIRWSSSDQDSTIRFATGYKDLTQWLLCEFGVGAAGKTIPGWVFGMEEGHRRALLQGYLSADGHRVPGSSAKWISTSVSRSLTIGIRILATTLGFTTSTQRPREGHGEIEGRQVNAKMSWGLQITEDDGRYTKIGMGHRWAKIRRETEPGQVSADVYDLTVADDHSFVAGGVVVHNCASFSMSGKRQHAWGEVKKYCLGPDTRVLLKDLTWSKAGDLRPGADLVGFEEEGDCGRARKFSTTKVIGAERVTRPSLTLVLDDGTQVTCSTDHRWLIVSGSNLRWKTSGRLEIGDQLVSVGRPWEEDASRDAGWLAGIFDGEGCLFRARSSRGRGLSVAQNPGLVLDRMRKILDSMGFDYGQTVHACGTVTLNIKGGLNERLRLLGELRPTRLVPKAQDLWQDLSVSAASSRPRIVEIRDVGKTEVVAISTRHKTLIAEGLLSHNSDTEQRTDDLFFEFARILKSLQPRAFAAENVKGLVIGAAKGFFKEILQALKDCGYQVKARVLDAQWLGVPQRRQRLIFIGIRNDLAQQPVHPSPLPYRYVLRDACPWIARAVHDTSGLFGIGEFGPDDICPTIIQSCPGHYKVLRDRQLTESEYADFTGKAIHKEWKKLKPGEGSDRYINLVKAHPDKPCPTVTQTGGQVAAASVTHPYEPRKFTILELRRLCGFPDDFQLGGPYTKQWERLGRAVPPPMSKAIGDAVASVLLGLK